MSVVCIFHRAESMDLDLSLWGAQISTISVHPSVHPLFPKPKCVQPNWMQDLWQIPLKGITHLFKIFHSFQTYSKNNPWSSWSSTNVTCWAFSLSWLLPYHPPLFDFLLCSLSHSSHHLPHTAPSRPLRTIINCHSGGATNGAFFVDAVVLKDDAPKHRGSW